MWVVGFGILLIIGAVANIIEERNKKDAVKVKPIIVWTSAEVYTFIRARSETGAYDSYADKFLAAGVDGRALKEMTLAMLEQFGVSEPLHRHCLLSSISAQP